MNKNLLSFIIPLLLLCLIATLFPPSYGYSTFKGFTFLFSSTIYKISWDKLILEYLLILFFSGLISVVYIKLGSFTLFYYLLSLLFSILMYFIVGYTTYLFYPSYQSVLESEKSIINHYSDLLQHSKKGPYILGLELSDVLDSTFNYRNYEYNYSHLHSLPDSLFPSADKYLIPFNEDSFKTVRSKSKDKFFLDPHMFETVLLPSHYKNFHIPYGYALQSTKLISEIDSISLLYLKSYFAKLLTFYELKSGYIQKVEEFLSIKNTLQYIISVSLLCILIIIFFIKRNYFKQRFSY